MGSHIPGWGWTFRPVRSCSRLKRYGQYCGEGGHPAESRPDGCGHTQYGQRCVQKAGEGHM